MKETDPIKHYFKKSGYQFQDIRSVVIGTKYLACLLKTGELGVCATGMQEFPDDYSYRRKPDADWICDRILLNAWFNARFNNQRNYPMSGDIFEKDHFAQYAHRIMIGYFGPLIKKFQEADLSLDIFDRIPHPGTQPMEELDAYLRKSEAVILTSTAISNGSFGQIIRQVKPNGIIFLLGPSSIMEPDMFQFGPVKKIYGMVFREQVQPVMDQIEQGHGTPEFGKFGQKVIF